MIAFSPGPGGDQRKTTMVSVGVRTGTRRANLRRSQLEEWPNNIRLRLGGDIALSWLVVRRR